jgi:hypothetical protein
MNTGYELHAGANRIGASPAGASYRRDGVAVRSTVPTPGDKSSRSRFAESTRMFSALRYPQFRRFWFGNLAAVAGQQMMWVAQGWLVYDLTKEAVYLGYVGLATAVPAILLNLAGGWTSAG